MQKTNFPPLSPYSYPDTFNSLSPKRKTFATEKKVEDLGKLIKKDSPPLKKRLSSSLEFENCHLDPDQINFSKVFLDLKRKTIEPYYMDYEEESCLFDDICCPEHTHVMINSECKKNYLHANYVELEDWSLIAAQYPIQVDLFWEACRSLDVKLIIDLTNKRDLEENERESYIDIGSQLGTISVENRQLIDSERFQLSTYKIFSLEKECLTTRLHFQEWPDGKVIDERDLDYIIAKIRQYQLEKTDRVLIHCLAGVGRSGTVIIAYILNRLIEENRLTLSNLLPEIERLILEGREKRGSEFVQNVVQFEFIYRWAWKCLSETANPLN